MYSVKRVTSAPSLYVAWFPFKGEHEGSIVTVPRIERDVHSTAIPAADKNHSLRELSAHVH